MKKNILITGGTGLLGQGIIEYLGTDKYNFRILSRSHHNLDDGVEYFNWNPANYEMDARAIENIHVIINLAGAGIANKRWTEQRKEVIISSRLDSIKTIKRTLQKHNVIPELIIGASAVGYYGDRGNERLNENSTPGNGFLSNVCQAWEAEYGSLSSLAKRMVIMRIGVVLSTQGGALKEMMKTNGIGIYGYFGNGKSYYPWIHIDDICAIVEQSILSNEYRGIINAVSTNPATIKTLIKAIKKAKQGIGIVAPIPEPLLKLVLGEMHTMITDSAKVHPDALLALEHDFHFDNPVEAINDLLIRKV